MPIPSNSHPTDEILEQYSMCRLSEAEATTLEEHLLTCAACQERQQEMDDYIRAMRQALIEIEKTSQAHSKWREFSFSRLPQLPKAAWAGALAAIIALVILVPWQQRQTQPFELQLRTLRGAETSLETIAPADTTLVLTVDLTGLPPNSAHEVEIADSTGNSVWKSVGQQINDAITLTVDHTLQPGQYWVRVYEPPVAPRVRGQLLREFSLRIQ